MLKHALLQLQQELLSSRREIDSQAVQILALENVLRDRPLLPPDAPESGKDKLIMEQGKTIRELEIVVRATKMIWASRCAPFGKTSRASGKWRWTKRQEEEAWADEFVKQLERR